MHFNRNHTIIIRFISEGEGVLDYSSGSSGIGRLDLCSLLLIFLVSPLQVMLSVWESLKDSNIGLVEDLDDLSGLGEDGQTLGHQLDAVLLGLLLRSVVLLDALEECLVASRLAHVLNSNVDALAELVSTMDLGHLNTDGRLGHVENDASSSVVELVGHTLVD